MLFLAIILLVPLVLAFGLLVSPWWPMKKVVNRKKFASLIGTSVVTSGIICVFLYIGAYSKLYFKEVWNYKITSIKHEERWSEEEMRTRQVPSGTDSEGNTTYRTETYYVTEYYGPNWISYDEYKKSHGISKREYDYWAKLWANQKHTGTHKGSAAGWDTPITGKIFKCHWPGKFENIYPYSEIHKYINKARVSKDILLKLPEATEAQKAKYPRPVDSDNTNPIISYNNYKISESEQMLMRRSNALLGRKYEIHAMIVILDSSIGSNGVMDVLTAWQGTNKNELVLFIGLDKDKKVAWCDCKSWLDLGDTTINAMWRDSAMATTFNVDKIAKSLRELVPKHWSRPEAETIDYLQIDIHWGWGLAAFLVTIGITTGAFFFVEYKIFEDVDEYGESIHKNRF